MTSCPDISYCTLGNMTFMCSYEKHLDCGLYQDRRAVDKEIEEQIEMGDLGLAARMKEVSRQAIRQPIQVIKDGKPTGTDWFGSMRRLLDN